MMENNIHVLVVNLNNIQLTKNCISDLMKQEDMNYDLTVIDNASSEDGTKEYFKLLENNCVKVVLHQNRVPLNWIWNDFYEKNHNQYLCMLNNDTRVTYNYIKTIKQVFEKEPDVKIVCHVTNNPNYCKVSDNLKYEVLYRKCRQGWDYSIRRDSYIPIPKQMQTYFGDDWLYSNIYNKNGKAAIILNSPIYHYLGASTKSLIGNEYLRDEREFKALGFGDSFSVWSGYSVTKPHIAPDGFFKYEPKLTINVVTYQRYDETKNILTMLKRQTDPRFIVDIWQDGEDKRKRELVESFYEPRFIYNENSIRQKRYGHDMRHKSILQCKTDWWCTTNDDNYISPFFVEVVLKHSENHDMVKYCVAMQNITWGGAPLKWNGSFSAMNNGIHDFETYSKHYKTLDPAVDKRGDVDAASFVVKTDIIKQYGGWWSMDFSGDWFVFKKMVDASIRINRIKQVLQVHI